MRHYLRFLRIEIEAAENIYTDIPDRKAADHLASDHLWPVRLRKMQTFDLRSGPT